MFGFYYVHVCGQIKINLSEIAAQHLYDLPNLLRIYLGLCKQPEHGKTQWGATLRNYAQERLRKVLAHDVIQEYALNYYFGRNCLLSLFHLFNYAE